MAGCWPSSCFSVFMDRDEVEVRIKLNARKKREAKNSHAVHYLFCSYFSLNSQFSFETMPAP